MHFLDHTLEHAASSSSVGSVVPVAIKLRRSSKDGGGKPVVASSVPSSRGTCDGVVTAGEAGDVHAIVIGEGLGIGGGRGCCCRCC